MHFSARSVQTVPGSRLAVFDSAMKKCRRCTCFRFRRLCCTDVAYAATREVLQRLQAVILRLPKAVIRPMIVRQIAVCFVSFYGTDVDPQWHSVIGQYWPRGLRACYAMWVTEVADVLCDVRYWGRVWACYAMSGTDIAYGATTS
eukprot:3879930-Rhodomonas_salina.2